MLFLGVVEACSLISFALSRRLGRSKHRVTEDESEQLARIQTAQEFCCESCNPCLNKKIYAIL